MTNYTASKVNTQKTIKSETFTSLRKAKSWARQNVEHGTEIVICDDEMKSRHIKLVLIDGRNNWLGSFPNSWLAA